MKIKEETFREIWENVFRITPEENRQSDIEKERKVEKYNSQNIHNILSHTESNLNRLQGNNNDTPITTDEINNAIKTVKTNTPRESRINKVIIKNLPDNAMKLLQSLTNHALFKNVKLIPKGNVEPTNPQNYRHFLYWK